MEMQVKIKMRYYLHPVTMAITKMKGIKATDKDSEKRGPLPIIGGNVNLYTHRR